MSIQDDDAEPVATTLSFVLEVHEGMTKKSFRIKERGSLKIKNKSPDEILRVESDDHPPPFLVPGYETPRAGFDVPPGPPVTVTISDKYVDGMRFTYRSQIGNSIPEDPIVIIERR